MKTNLSRKIVEGSLSSNPAMDGARAAQWDARAYKDKNSPFGYYAAEFLELERLRNTLTDMSREYKDVSFQKAANFIESAQHAMLKAGR